MTKEFYKSLKQSFISDTQNAVLESQKYISSVSGFNSFEDFYNYHSEHPHISTCQSEWSKAQMSVHCIDCSNTSQSCLCLSCFLSSNHEGHDYLIRPNSLGNCDCGDLSLWKRSGFCPKHQGLDDGSHPEDYLDEKLRTALTDVVFKAAFSALKYMICDDGQKISLIFQFLISFLKFGDGFRRLITISLTEKINFKKLFFSVFDGSPQFNESFQQFCGLIVNDEIFKFNFSPVNYKLQIEKILPYSVDLLHINEDDLNKNYTFWNHFWFHSFENKVFLYNIKRRNWDWVSYILKFLDFLKEIFRFTCDENYNKDSYPDGFFLSAYLKDIPLLQPERSQLLFDKYFTESLATGSSKGVENGVNDTIYLCSFKQEQNITYLYHPLLFADLAFYPIVEGFRYNRDLKLDKMIDAMNKDLDISEIFSIGNNKIACGNENENDLLIRNLLHQTKVCEVPTCSFHNGTKFFISLPIFRSLCYLFRNDNITRIKLARLLSMKENQELRLKLGIITLNSILSMTCHQQFLVPKQNISADAFIKIMGQNQSRISSGLPIFFPLFQLLVGLDCNQENDFSLKEFYAFEMAREIGLFDDFESSDYEDENIIEQQKQMTFLYLYLSILLVIERTLFNFNRIEFMKEQIIFGLKMGISHLDDLKDVFDQSIAPHGRYMSFFNKIINEVAIARQKAKKSNDAEDGDVSSSSSEISFDLKKDIEFKNISAINLINGLKSVMNDEIKKHPDQLIKIPSFEDEETYFFHPSEKLIKVDEYEENDSGIDPDGLKIKLKDFLMTPSVLAMVYFTLRSNTEIEASEVDLNDHLAMNILILISKFLNDDNSKNPSFDATTTITYSSNIVDLINQLKRVIFSYKVEQDGHSSVSNTLTKDAFELLLKMKICPSGKEPKSFVDLLMAKGKVGKSVLSLLLPDFIGSNSNSEEFQDIYKLNKIRANKMKAQIMNSYKNAIANFNISEDTIEEPSHDEASEKEVCAICRMNKDKEILAYPLYLFRTKFPFIIDKPPVVEIPVSKAAKEVDVSQEEFADSEEMKEEVEMPIQSPDDIFASILAQNPDLENSPLLEIIYNHIKEKYEELVKQREIEKLERQERRKQMIEKRNEELKRMELELKNSGSTVKKRLTPGNLFVIQFGICQHLIHPECIESANFTCPIDRSYKNGFLPNISDLSDDTIYADASKNSLTEAFTKALNSFLDKYSQFIKGSENGKIIDVFVELVKSISGLIATYEIRQRSLPDSLDSKKTKFLARNLFLSAWHSYRMKRKPEMKYGFTDDESNDVESRLTIFQRFIKRLLECDEIESSIESKTQCFNKIVADFVSEFQSGGKDEKELFLFLRRVCLTDYFLLLNNDDGKLIDWDDVVNCESLQERFGIQFKTLDSEFYLEPLSFMQLPKELLRLSLPPYNLPVEQTHKVCMFNILDYNFLINNYNPCGEQPEVDFETLIEKNKRNLTVVSGDGSLKMDLAMNFSYKKSPVVLLFVGQFASSVWVIEGRRFALLKPFYLDRYGCTDIDYKRGQPLFLNDLRYERVMDEILSGEFLNNSSEF